MLTLTYGLKKPQTNDRGPVVFPALEANFQQLDSHDHNGVNSKKLTGASIASVSQAVSSGSWSALGDGYYKQAVNMPTNMDFDTTTLQIRLSTGQIIHPTVKRLSTTQFEIYVSDNTINLVVLFN